MTTENYNPDCVFCSKKKEDFFLENENFAAVCNISPILPGHSLVIPKFHTESIFSLAEGELKEFMELGRDVAKLLSAIFNTESFDFFIQEKEAAGQSIPHIHLHVVPRIKGDFEKPRDWYPEIQKEGFQLPPDQLTAITERLKEQAKSIKGVLK